jgi:hypothetical protein
MVDRKPLSEGRRDEAETGVVTRPILPTPDRKISVPELSGPSSGLEQTRSVWQARNRGQNPEAEADPCRVPLRERSPNSRRVGQMASRNATQAVSGTAFRTQRANVAARSLIAGAPAVLGSCGALERRLRPASGLRGNSSPRSGHGQLARDQDVAGVGELQPFFREDGRSDGSGNLKPNRRWG